MPKPADQQYRLSRSCGGLLSRLAYEHAKQKGLNVRDLLQQAGLEVADINNPDARLNVAGQINFVSLLAETLGDSELGVHLANAFDLRRLEFLYYVPGSADTLGKALQRIERYSGLANEAVVMRVDKGKFVRLTVDYSGVARHSDEHQIEFFITAGIRLFRRLVGREIKPLDVRLAHRRSGVLGDLDRFLGTHAHSGANTDEIVFAATDWDLPIPTSDPYLYELLVRCCEDALKRRATKGSPLRVRVENEVAALLPHGQAQVKTVASALGMSTRTLARRLAAEDVSFAQIVRELRAALAQRYISDRNLPISRVAWLLGYKEISAFSNAFRRWTGMTPSRARTLSARQIGR